MVEDYISGKAKPAAQDHAKATFTKHITKEDGQIDLAHPPTHEAFDRMVRAYSPWPGTWTEVKVKSDKSKVLRLKFLPRYKLPDTSYQILIQPEGKHAMSISEFSNGYPEARELIKKLY